MNIAIDLGAREPHSDPEWPGVTAIMRALPSTVSLFCRDQAKRFDTDGSVQFDDNRYFSWLFRFGIESMEGMNVKTDGKTPAFLGEHTLGLSIYPIVNTWWFDRVHPLAVRAFGQAVEKWNKLTPEQKKRSDSRDGGDDATDKPSSPTADDAPRSSASPTDTTQPAASH